MKNDILAENQSKRITVSIPLLLMYSLFTVWQMGVIFFSGTSLSLGGKTPLPISVNGLTIIIVAAYLLCAVWLVFFQKLSVITARIVIGASLLSSILLYMPFSPRVLAILISFQVFTCVFMIGIGISVISNLFTEKTELYDALIISTFGGILIAIIQNDLFRLPFIAFQVFTTISLALLLFFFFKMPSKIWPRYVSKSEKVPFPKSFAAGIFLLVILSCILVLFGNTVSESETYGLSISYISGAVFAIIVFLLWKAFKITPLRCAAPLIGFATVGFVIAAVSSNTTALLVASGLIGAAWVVCNLSSFYSIILMKSYPSRFIVPLISIIALCTVIIHTTLLDAFRADINALYLIYAVVAVIMALVYIILEPYLLWSIHHTSPKAVSAATSPETTYEQDSEKTNFEEVLRSSAFDILSGQEYRVADLILKGYSGSEIAKILNITENTMSGYRKTLYSKLQIHSKRELYNIVRNSGNNKQ